MFGQGDRPLHQVAEILGQLRLSVVFLQDLADLLAGGELDVRDRGSFDALIAEFHPDDAGVVSLFGEFDDAILDGVGVDIAPFCWFVCRRAIRTG